MNKEFRALCTPAKLYFVIALISIVFALFNHFDILVLVINFLFALVWTLILSCLCDKGFSYLAWGLVLFPYFLILISFFSFKHRLTEAMDTNKKEGIKTGFTDSFSEPMGPRKEAYGPKI
jgi:hypothetical protein